ncbi:MAG: beta-propeller domain-containing protein, partial [Methanomassiliicoccales archaeon]|nr:beta-propeller domain-containing protein [Methanomassiliicoccales archaeon]
YIMRAHYIGDVLYTITDTTIRAYQISSLELLNQLTYQAWNEYYFPCLIGTGEVAPVAAMR